MKKIYIVRHCEADGQSAEANLTSKGLKQATELSTFFSDIHIDRILSSPYKRALQSIQPLAKQLNVEIEIDKRLKERVLSTEDLPDWFEKLKMTFDDVDLKFEGGESSNEAMQRAADVVDNIFKGQTNHTIIVTHGNLMALLLERCIKDFGFEEWQTLSNPDVFLLIREGGRMTYERLWK